jgi:hypothetical protein
MMLLIDPECRSLLMVLNRKKHSKSFSCGGKILHRAIVKLIHACHVNCFRAYHLSQTKSKTPLAMPISIDTTIHTSDLSGETNTYTTTDIAVASVNTESD